MGSERIWAPWRMGYVTKAGGGGEETAEQCIFCAKPASGDDSGELIVHRGKHCFVILNLYPYTSGHLMVAPYEHIGSLQLVSPEPMAEMMTLVQSSIKVLTETHRPHGFNVGMNQGRVAGAGVEHHIHMHVVPRWNGDNNFMPVLADTRVMPQSLEEARELIGAEFAKPIHHGTATGTESTAGNDSDSPVAGREK